MAESQVMRAYIAGTFDTKVDELNYLAKCIAATGIEPVTVDLSTRNSNNATDVAAADVAAHHPQGSATVLQSNDRGESITAMADAFRYFLLSRNDLGGVLGAGGSGGTALIAPAMQALAVGIPKLIVSTVASGNVAPYVGSADITMMYSVTDVQGLNRISRRVLGNAAHALAGMIANAGKIDWDSSRPAIGLTMFGVTTDCVQAVAASLDKSHDCLVFHATGTGGQAMEKLADSGLITAMLDITTTEIADMLIGGVFPATDDRMGAAIRSGLPYIGSVGALDMVNFGARGTIADKFKQRLFHVHNPQVTLMRTTIEENRAMAVWISERLNRMQGAVRFLLPEKGVSALDAEGQVFYDPAADAALFDTLEENLIQSPDRQLVRVPAHINDPEFVTAVVGCFHEIAGQE